MPSMDWQDFQRSHHRPHLFIVSMVEGKTKPFAGKADFERLAVSLGAIGNYAINTQEAAIYIALEDDADADRLAAVLKPQHSTRETEWASKSVASLDTATRRTICAILK
jgi:hypothetical protein